MYNQASTCSDDKNQQAMIEGMKAVDILLVEDNTLAANQAKKCLEKNLACQITIADSGNQALQAITEKNTM